MVESSQQPGEEEDQDKTFLEQPDILDKVKAAALITDGIYSLHINAYTLFFRISRSRKSS